MLLSKLFPEVNQLSHPDKLRLIHFLLLEVAKEDGCNLESVNVKQTDKGLLDQLAATEAVVWSPIAGPEAVQALSDMLTASKGIDR